MSYKAINATEIEVGQPVNNITLTKLKDNLADHQERVVSLEGGSATQYPPMLFELPGYYAEQGTAENWAKNVMPFNLTIVGVRLYINRAGTDNTTEIDLLTKPAAGGTYTSIFTTRPSVSFDKGDDWISTNGVLNFTMVNLNQGDWLRLDTTSVQDGAWGALVRIDYIKR